MKSYSDILAALEARKDRSAWNKGVTIYALSLLDNYQERAEFEGREAASCKELEEWLLNGASTWGEYSWGGSALILHVLNMYAGMMHANICSSKREADAVARAWNESYKRNGTALF